MNKRNILRLLTAGASMATAAAVVDLTSVAQVLPDNVSKFIILVGPLCLGIKEVAVVIGDYLDNGKRDDSFKY